MLDQARRPADQRVGPVALHEVDGRRRQVRRADEHQARLVRGIELERCLVAVVLLDVHVDAVKDARHGRPDGRVGGRLRQARFIGWPRRSCRRCRSVVRAGFLVQRARLGVAVLVGRAARAGRLARAEAGEEGGHGVGGWCVAGWPWGKLVRVLLSTTREDGKGRVDALVCKSCGVELLLRSSMRPVFDSSEGEAHQEGKNGFRERTCFSMRPGEKDRAAFARRSRFPAATLALLCSL